jgi:hypothetical protein
MHGARIAATRVDGCAPICGTWRRLANAERAGATALLVRPAAHPRTRAPANRA